MGFLSSSCSLIRFTVVDPVSDERWAEIPKRLKQHAFIDIDDIPEVSSAGWVCFDSYLDNEWRTAPPEKGSYILFSLRQDTRNVPAGLIKKHFDIAVMRELEENAKKGKDYVSKERKKEIKEQIIRKLQQRTLPTPAEFNVIWNKGTNEIWFTGTSNKIIEFFINLFTTTFDLHIRQLTPGELAINLLGEQKADEISCIELSNFSAS